MLSETGEEEEEEESSTATTTAAATTAAAVDTNESVTEEAIQPPTSFDPTSLRTFALGVLRAFYNAEINKKLAMKNYAELKMEPPSPIDIDAQLGSNMSDASIAALMGSGGNVLSKDTVWSIEESKWVP